MTDQSGLSRVTRPHLALPQRGVGDVSALDGPLEVEQRAVVLAILPPPPPQQAVSDAGRVASVACSARRRQRQASRVSERGELARLLGAPLADDRLAQLRELARATGAVILSKGPTTVVVGQGTKGLQQLFVDSGTAALATAGTGDVLSGLIAAMLARGLEATRAAALAAFVHGRAGARAPGSLLASELPSFIGLILREAEDGG